MSSFLALTMLLSAGVGIGVGQDAYPVGDITVSPSGSACIGGTVTLSGTGATPGSTIDIAMIHSPGEFPAAPLGTTSADGSGNWSVTTTIPTMGIDGNGNASPIVAGTYILGAIEDVNPDYLSETTLNVLDCTVLPSTGASIAGPGIAIAAVLLIAGTALIVWRRKLTA